MVANAMYEINDQRLGGIRIELRRSLTDRTGLSENR